MNSKVKVIIIEDEMPAAELVAAYLEEFPEIEVVRICNDGFTGLKSIHEIKPDLIFLDVQMPKLSGFEMLELLDDQPAVIFTTAFDEYALKAFEMSAVDYLLKPFSRERFSIALKKALERISAGKTSLRKEANEKLSDILPPGDIIERVVVKKNNKIIVIPVLKITHIEAYDDYVIIHSEGNRHIKQKTMKYYEDHLDHRKFIRIHRSWIVNVDCIDQIMLWEKETYMVKLKSGEELRASRAGYKRLKELF
jgi:two-component system, LytTR family, response regulator